MNFAYISSLNVSKTKIVQDINKVLLSKSDHKPYEPACQILQMSLLCRLRKMIWPMGPR